MQVNTPGSTSSINSGASSPMSPNASTPGRKPSDAPSPSFSKKSSEISDDSDLSDEDEEEPFEGEIPNLNVHNVGHLPGIKQLSQAASLKEANNLVNVVQVSYLVFSGIFLTRACSTKLPRCTCSRPLR